MENPPTPETGHGPQHTSPQHTSHSLRLALHQMFLRSLRGIIGDGGDGYDEKHQSKPSHAKIDRIALLSCL